MIIKPLDIHCCKNKDVVDSMKHLAARRQYADKVDNFIKAFDALPRERAKIKRGVFIETAPLNALRSCVRLPNLSLAVFSMIFTKQSPYTMK